ncbi:MAG: hypothetical protein NC452_02310 [Eubacterium sp.]|nr:hypothetical protein [Eubacterium sp.]
MKEFLLYLLQAVIIAAVPTVTACLCSFLAKKRDEAQERILSENQKTANDLKDRLLAEALDNVATAVKKTNQTYVDTLKESGAFSFENQEKAFEKSMQTATEIMRQEVEDFIFNEYGDLRKWLGTQIEVAVNTEKNVKK